MDPRQILTHTIVLNPAPPVYLDAPRVIRLWQGPPDLVISGIYSREAHLLAVHPYARVLLQMHRAHGELREERWTLHVPKLVLRDDAVRRHRPVPWPCLPIAVQLGGGALRGGAARCCTAFLLQVILLQVPVIFGLALGTGARAGVMIGRGPETHS